MYGPDSYLYETNLALLASMGDDELADLDTLAANASSSAILAELGAWLGGALAAIADWFAPTAEQAEHYRAMPPLY